MRFLLCLVCLGVNSAPRAEDGPSRLRAYLQDLQSLSARFEQVRYDEDDREVERAKGSLKLLRPGRFLWDYREPFRQQIISDAKHVWLYDIELAQVTVQDFDAALGSSPAALLGASVSIESAYEVSELPPDEGLVWVGLSSLDEEGDFAGLRIAFDASGIKLMELDDNFGQRTRIEFFEVSVNATIDPALFQFQPPPGVDVVRAE